MLRGMFIFGAVAATDVPALQAQSQMHPGVAHFQTLFAALRRFRLHRPYLIEMRALCHVFSPR
jgi:hypothetical protein